MQDFSVRAACRSAGCPCADKVNPRLEPGAHHVIDVVFGITRISRRVGLVDYDTDRFFLRQMTLLTLVFIEHEIRCNKRETQTPFRIITWSGWMSLQRQQKPARPGSSTRIWKSEWFISTGEAGLRRLFVTEACRVTVPAAFLRWVRDGGRPRRADGCRSLRSTRAAGFYG